VFERESKNLLITVVFVTMSALLQKESD